MYDYTMINTNEGWRELLSQWKREQVSSFAIDFEGEFNLHIYGEHLCLIQIFDGRRYYLVDPLALDMKEVLPFLTDPELEKVMFDSSSDASLIYKSYTAEMKGVYDVALSAGVLGFTGNLHALIEFCGIEIAPVTSKKKNQMANWLVRPIRDQLVSYALSDVEHLFTIQKVLKERIRKEGKEKEERQVQKQGTKVKTVYKPGWAKLNGYRRLSKEQKVYLRHFFTARDDLARQRNLPSYRILDKKVLVVLAKEPEKVESLAKHKDPLLQKKLLDALKAARDDSRRELS